MCLWVSFCWSGKYSTSAPSRSLSLPDVVRARTLTFFGPTSAVATGS